MRVLNYDNQQIFKIHFEATNFESYKATTVSPDIDQATNENDSNNEEATEAPVEPTTAGVIGEDAAEALGELDNLSDLGFQ